MNTEDVPDAVLKVPRDSVVLYMKDYVTEQDKHPDLEHVFLGRGVTIPPEIERILSFNLKFIPHADPNPNKVMAGFDEFARLLHCKMHFAYRALAKKPHPSLEKLLDFTG